VLSADDEPAIVGAVGEQVKSGAAAYLAAGRTRDGPGRDRREHVKRWPGGGQHGGADAARDLGHLVRRPLRPVEEDLGQVLRRSVHAPSLGRVGIDSETGRQGVQATHKGATSAGEVPPSLIHV
jgi:hypothetical protein